jgi:iron complex outermembrane receptor protein
MKQYTRAFAFYAESEWEPPVLDGRWSFLQSFILDGGLRFSWERKEFFISSDFVVTGGGSTESKPPVTEVGTWTGWSGFASATYRISPSHDIYVKYSRGWKPGHFNGGTLFSSQLIDPVDLETVDSFEAGIRTEWFDGVVSLDVTGFTYAYRNLQVFLVKQDSRGFTVAQLENSERANVNGVELELHTMPVEGLQVSFAGAWLDSAYTEFGTTYDRRVPGNPPTVEQVDVDFSGNRLIASPVWSFSGSVAYTWALDRWGTLEPRFSYSFKDDVFFGPNEGRGQKGRLPDGTLGQEAFWLLNAGLTWMSEDSRFELGVWVRNILDENYRVQSFDLTDPFRLTIDAYGLPRTFGVTLGVNYF